MENTFRFQQFSVEQDQAAMKVGTDGVLLGAWVELDHIQRALDIGTGTGLIALMIAQRHPHAIVHGVDIDTASWEQCRKNFRAAPWHNRLQAYNEAIQEFEAPDNCDYDLIISNPPFFSGGVLSLNESRKRVRHTVKLPTGDLLNAVRRLLAENGTFALILPYLEGLRFREVAERSRLFCRRLTEVKSLARKPTERLLMQFSQQPGPCHKDELVLLAGDGNMWTAAYGELVKDFYLTSTLRQKVPHKSDRE